VFAYVPSHLDTRLQQFIEEDIVNEYRDERTDAEKNTYEEKIVALSQDLSPRLTRHMEELADYRQSKKTIVADKDAPRMIELERVIVTIDGKWALNMRSWPDKNFEVVGKLEEWSVVKVLVEMNGRYQIEQEWFEKNPWVLGDFVQKVAWEAIRQWGNEAIREAEEKNEESESAVTDRAFSDSQSQGTIKTITVSPNDVGSLRVREWPSADAQVIGSIKVWESYDVYEEINAYFRIEYKGSEGWIAVNFVHLKWTEAPTHHLTPTPDPIDLDVDLVWKQAFLDQYRPLVDSKDKPLISLCTEYYDEIDAIAREYDFPVELIIATWFREHTCKFKNPANGRWNFQIITRYYPPGPITREQFEQQVIDFINFSYGKREFYDQTQNFWPEPISLSYNDFDLLSIRKHAIYYNGIVSTPEKNVYANQNFNGIRPASADGIVAAFLKVLKYGLEK